MVSFRSLGVIIAILSLVALLVPGTDAFQLASVRIEPPGNQAAGTPMSVGYMVFFPHAGANETFPAGSTLRMSTDLAGALWEPVLVLDGRETRMPLRNGSELDISGYYLSYPADQNVQLFVTLSGTIPQNPSAIQDILTVQETDAGMSVRSTAHIAMPAAPFAPVSTASVRETTRKTTSLKTFTPIPTGTPSSPLTVIPGALALCGAALFAIRRR